MTEEAKDLVPEHLRAIRKDLADTRREISGCLLGVEQHVLALSTGRAAHIFRTTP